MRLIISVEHMQKYISAESIVNSLSRHEGEHLESTYTWNDEKTLNILINSEYTFKDGIDYTMHFKRNAVYDPFDRVYPFYMHTWEPFFNYADTIEEDIYQQVAVPTTAIKCVAVYPETGLVACYEDENPSSLSDPDMYITVRPTVGNCAIFEVKINELYQSLETFLYYVGFKHHIVMYEGYEFEYDIDTYTIDAVYSTLPIGQHSLYAFNRYNDEIVIYQFTNDDLNSKRYILDGGIENPTFIDKRVIGLHFPYSNCKHVALDAGKFTTRINYMFETPGIEANKYINESTLTEIAEYKDVGTWYSIIYFVESSSAEKVVFTGKATEDGCIKQYHWLDMPTIVTCDSGCLLREYGNIGNDPNTVGVKSTGDRIKSSFIDSKNTNKICNVNYYLDTGVVEGLDSSNTLLAKQYNLPVFGYGTIFKINKINNFSSDPFDNLIGGFFSDIRDAEVRNYTDISSLTNSTPYVNLPRSIDLYLRLDSRKEDEAFLVTIKNETTGETKLVTVSEYLNPVTKLVIPKTMQTNWDVQEITITIDKSSTFEIIKKVTNGASYMENAFYITENPEINLTGSSSILCTAYHGYSYEGWYLKDKFLCTEPITEGKLKIWTTLNKAESFFPYFYATDFTPQSFVYGELEFDIDNILARKPEANKLDRIEVIMETGECIFTVSNDTDFWQLTEIREPIGGPSFRTYLHNAIENIECKIKDNRYGHETIIQDKDYTNPLNVNYTITAINNGTKTIAAQISRELGDPDDPYDVMIKPGESKTIRTYTGTYFALEETIRIYKSPNYNDTFKIGFSNSNISAIDSIYDITSIIIDNEPATYDAISFNDSYVTLTGLSTPFTNNSKIKFKVVYKNNNGNPREYYKVGSDDQVGIVSDHQISDEIIFTVKNYNSTRIALDYDMTNQLSPIYGTAYIPTIIASDLIFRNGYFKWETDDSNSKSVIINDITKTTCSLDNPQYISYITRYNKLYFINNSGLYLILNINGTNISVDKNETKNIFNRASSINEEKQNIYISCTIRNAEFALNKPDGFTYGPDSMFDETKPGFMGYYDSNARFEPYELLESYIDTINNKFISKYTLLYDRKVSMVINTLFAAYIKDNIKIKELMNLGYHRPWQFIDDENWFNSTEQVCFNVKLNETTNQDQDQVYFDNNIYINYGLFGLNWIDNTYNGKQICCPCVEYKIAKNDQIPTGVDIYFKSLDGKTVSKELDKNFYVPANCPDFNLYGKNSLAFIVYANIKIYNKNTGDLIEETIKALPPNELIKIYDVKDISTDNKVLVSISTTSNIFFALDNSIAPTQLEDKKLSSIISDSNFYRKYYNLYESNSESDKQTTTSSFYDVYIKHDLNEEIKSIHPIFIFRCCVNIKNILNPVFDNMRSKNIHAFWSEYGTDTWINENKNVIFFAKGQIDKYNSDNNIFYICSENLSFDNYNIPLLSIEDPTYGPMIGYSAVATCDPSSILTAKFYQNLNGTYTSAEKEIGKDKSGSIYVPAKTELKIYVTNTSDKDKKCKIIIYNEDESIADIEIIDLLAGESKLSEHLYYLFPGQRVDILDISTGFFNIKYANAVLKPYSNILQNSYVYIKENGTQIATSSRWINNDYLQIPYAGTGENSGISPNTPFSFGYSFDKTNTDINKVRIYFSNNTAKNNVGIAEQGACPFFTTFTSPNNSSSIVSANAYLDIGKLDVTCNNGYKTTYGFFPSIGPAYIVKLNKVLPAGTTQAVFDFLSIAYSKRIESNSTTGDYFTIPPTSQIFLRLNYLKVGTEIHKYFVNILDSTGKIIGSQIITTPFTGPSQLYEFPLDFNMYQNKDMELTIQVTDDIYSKYYNLNGNWKRIKQ